MKRGDILVILLLLAIFSSMIIFADNVEAVSRGAVTEVSTVRGVVEGTSRGSVEVFTGGWDVRDAIHGAPNLASIKSIIEECKKLAEVERNSPVGLLGRKFLGDDAIKGYLDYGVRVKRYKCTNKNIDLFRLNMYYSKDIYTTLKIKMSNSNFGDIETYYNLETAKLSGDNYLVNVYVVIGKEVFGVREKTVKKENLESGILSDKEIKDINLVISKSFAKSKQLDLSQDGKLVEATGKEKVGVLGKEIKFLGTRISSIIRSTMYPKEKFYYDEDGSVVRECLKKYCKSSGFRVEKISNVWKVFDKQGNEMKLSDKGNWVIKN